MARESAHEMFLQNKQVRKLRAQALSTREDLPKNHRNHATTLPCRN